MRTEPIRRGLFALGLAIIGAVSAAPHLFPGFPPESLLEKAGSAAIALVVGGYYFVMLGEVIFARGLPRKWLWILFFFALPIFSAYIYFGVSRSIKSDANVSAS